jgi:hypothetical protein
VPVDRVYSIDEFPNINEVDFEEAIRDGLSGLVAAHYSDAGWKCLLAYDEGSDPPRKVFLFWTPRSLDQELLSTAQGLVEQASPDLGIAHVFLPEGGEGSSRTWRPG